MWDLPFRFSANISILFTELPYLQRPAAARAAGFTEVESWWPYAGPVAPPTEVDALVDALERAGVTLSALNLYGGDLAAGERGLACRPDRQDELAVATENLLRVAERTGCRMFNLLYGQLDDRWTEAEQHQTAATAIGVTADRIASIGGTVLLEPLTRGLNGRYPLVDGDDVVRLLEGPLAGATNVRLLFDLFHLGSNGVDLPDAARRLLPWIGHVQFADSPGRGEPGTGTLPLEQTLRTLADVGYRGPVAAEYVPTRPTPETLAWLPRSS